MHVADAAFRRSAAGPSRGRAPAQRPVDREQSCRWLRRRRSSRRLRQAWRRTVSRRGYARRYGATFSTPLAVPAGRRAEDDEIRLASVSRQRAESVNTRSAGMSKLRDRRPACAPGPHRRCRRSPRRDARGPCRSRSPMCMWSKLMPTTLSFFIVMGSANSPRRAHTESSVGSPWANQAGFRSFQTFSRWAFARQALTPPEPKHAVLWGGRFEVERIAPSGGFGEARPIAAKPSYWRGREVNPLRLQAGEYSVSAISLPTNLPTRVR